MRHLLLLLVAISCPNVLSAQEDDGITSILGTVIAFEQSPARASKLSSVEKTEVIIVRVDKRRELSPTYLRLVYSYLSQREALPEKMFTSGGMWRFIVSRNKSCDGSISSAYPKSNRKDVFAGDDNAMIYLVPVGKFDSKLPIDSVMSCYELQSYGYKIKKS